MEGLGRKPSILDDFLTEYEPISRAPSLSQLERIAEERKVPFEVVIAEERERRYKALHSQTQGVYLVQNPAVWVKEGAAVVMQQPKFLCSLRDRTSGETMRKGRGNLGELF